MPLSLFVEHLNSKRFGRERPETVLSIEDKICCDAEKRARKRAEKLSRRGKDQSKN